MATFAVNTAAGADGVARGPVSRVVSAVIKVTVYSGNPFVDAFGWTFFTGGVAGAGEEAAIQDQIIRDEAILAWQILMAGFLRQNMASVDP